MGGHDQANTHDQSLETDLGPERAGSLKPIWSFYDGHLSGDVSGNLGDFNSVATESYGCVFVGGAEVGGNDGDVYAIDVNTGKLQWKAVIPASTAGLAGTVVGSPIVVGDRLVVIANQLADGKRTGPYVAALDVHTGKQLWASKPITTAVNDYSNSTPAVYDDVIVAGWSGKEGYPTSHGGVGLVDLNTGAVLKTTHTIPERDWTYQDGKPKYAGGGVWTTPAVDPTTGYAFYGDGNPYSKQIESDRTNAIMKLDVDRTRATFGEIVAWTKGDIDQYNSTIYTLSRPTCAILPDDPFRMLPVGPFQNIASDSLGCVQLDLGFGAAANLFPDAHGHLLVGDLQKSGTYLVADSTTMKAVRREHLGQPCEVCNGGSAAYDAKRHLIISSATPGSFVLAMPSFGGAPLWKRVIGDPLHYEPMTIADGVAYTVDFYGNLRAWNEQTGDVVLTRSLMLDGGPDAAAYSSSGVSVARHTVFVTAGSHLVAYRPSR